MDNSEPTDETDDPESPGLSPEAFLLNAPLYDRIDISEEDRDWIQQVQYFTGALDAHCIECEQSSVFHRDTSYTAHLLPSDAIADRRFGAMFNCSRSRDHQLYFLCRVGEGSIQKIGQYPSVADLHAYAIGKYRAILGAERYRELARGVGLSAHGVGIGAFVYLRRVFESLIEEARQAADPATFDSEAFGHAKMEARIVQLQDQLPAFLVENRSLYGILSTGVHSLTDRECLQHFDTVRLGIELILDERLAQAEQRKKVASTSKAITMLKGKLKPSNRWRRRLGAGAGANRVATPGRANASTSPVGRNAAGPSDAGIARAAGHEARSRSVGCARVQRALRRGERLGRDAQFGVHVRQLVKLPPVVLGLPFRDGGAVLVRQRLVIVRGKRGRGAGRGVSSRSA